MEQTKRADHLWRVSELVDRLEGQLTRKGRLEDDTRQCLIQIRDSLVLYTASNPVQDKPDSKK